METALYLGTAVIAILWSVWIYLSWEGRARLREDSGFRIVLIIAPSSYFLLIALSGWSSIADFRLDLAALVVLDAVTLLCALALGILSGLARADARRGYLALLVVYNAAAILTVGAAFIIRSHSTLIMKLAAIVGQWGRLDFFSFSWLGEDEATRRPDLTGLLNKIFIALLSYIPIAVVRAVGSARQRRRVLRELKALRERVDSLEQRLSERQIQA